MSFYQFGEFESLKLFSVYSTHNNYEDVIKDFQKLQKQMILKKKMQ